MGLYHKLSDMELLQLLKTDDDEAFSEIFQRYQPLLLNFTYKKIRERDEAKDVLQDIFIQLWNNRAVLEVKSLSSYLYTAALNKIRDRYKHLVIHEEHVGQLQKLIEAQKAEGSDYLIREKDILALIEKEIAALPDKMQEVFRLRNNAYLSNKEIALKLGISEQTVETHMKRALKTLRDKLGPAIYIFFIL